MVKRFRFGCCLALTAIPATPVLRTNAPDTSPSNAASTICNPSARARSSTLTGASVTECFLRSSDTFSSISLRVLICAHQTYLSVAASQIQETLRQGLSPEQRNLANHWPAVADH